MAIVKQLKIALYAQPDGAGTAMLPLSIDNHGMADKVHPGPGRTPIFGRDEFGRYIVKTTNNDPPGGLNTSTIEEDDCGTYTFLTEQFKQFGCFPLQERWYKCGRLDGPNWDKLWHYGDMTITQKTHGAAPSREAADAVVFDSFEVSWPYTIELLKHQLTSLTIDEDQNLNSIAVLSDLPVGCDDCFPGYEPDTIIYIGADARAGSPADKAELWYSTNGGGSFLPVTIDPFAAGEDILFVGQIYFLTDEQFRVVVINDQVATQLKYSDFDIGAEGTASWSAGTTIGAGTVTAFEWLSYARMYGSNAGDIYVSEDQGATFGAAIYTGSNNINAFAKSFDGTVYAVGASNTILRERNQSDTFEVLTGPTGGGDFHSVFIANDGRIYAGNGQSLYVSVNDGANVGGWSELKDFGSNRIVRTINCPGGSQSQGGDSQLIRVVVDNTTPGTGEVWESEDGGATFRQLSSLTNVGYNDSYWSPINDNLSWIIGDSGVVQKFTTVS